ncbi:metal ABC transporter solute-binding protein, Zn/Mn family [Oceanobacillus senegalensis]|uniref:metal ABC transporter solute-binding protein, Zn/Mn family n=1 Tax=Oceanobacillus senegalensis TaxID=1936063 RepID=UPI000A308763|nr:zinc ABC transporter substrate-binding protein [Oceanobacillus senegalensis]
MKHLKAIVLILVITTIVAGCTSTETKNSKENNNEELVLYSSLYPIQFATERIAGNTATVKSVYPPGVDAHTFEPTSKDMTDIAKSDAFFYLGNGMEAFAETAADALKNQDVKLMEFGNNENLFHTNESEHTHDEEPNHETESDHEGHNHGDSDPHIWLDPSRMLEMSEMIKSKLIELNPESESIYMENFETLKKDLQKLDNAYSETLEGKENKKILVAHAAYGYWEEAYGLEQLAINKSSGSEPSQKELTEIIDQAKKNNIEYIISEQNSSSRLTDVIRKEINAEEVTVHNLSVLTDEDIANDEDYLSLMYSNLETLNLVTQ